jgi:hypothetical protein
MCAGTEGNMMCMYTTGCSVRLLLYPLPSVLLTPQPTKTPTAVLQKKKSVFHPQPISPHTWFVSPPVTLALSRSVGGRFVS